MSAFGEREADAIRNALGGLERDVDVLLELGPSATPITLLAAGGRELDPIALTRNVVEGVCALSDSVRLEVVEHDEPGPWPRTTIGRGLVYRGMPVGYELTSLVHAIVEVGRSTSSLSPESLARLDGLDEDVVIDVFVTPT